VRDIAKDFGNIREQRIAQILKQVLEAVRYLHDEAQIEA
jgi:serine/threonine protein kinase